MSNTVILEEFGKLKRMLNLMVVQELSTTGAGPKQAHMLRQIAKRGSCSQRELAEATLTDPAAIGRGIESLIRQGWIVRKDDPSDSRSWKIELSARGRREIASLEKAVDRVADKFLQKFNEGEKATFTKLLRKASDNLEAAMAAKKRKK